LRPVATTAAYLPATSGGTSGVGFASANTMPFGAIAATASSSICPPDTPIRTSAPRSASAAVPVRRASFVSAAPSAFPPARGGRAWAARPARSTPPTLPPGGPPAIHLLRHAPPGRAPPAAEETKASEFETAPARGLPPGSEPPHRRTVLIVVEHRDRQRRVQS